MTADTMLPMDMPMPDLDLPEPPQPILTRLHQKWDNFNAWRVERFKTLRPWSEFFDRTAFSVPSKGEVFGRLAHNIGYFSTNYLVVIACITAYCLVTNITFFFAMAFSVAAWTWYKTRTTPVYFGNTEIGPLQGYVGLSVMTVILFYFTSGSSTLFWLIFLAVTVVCGHASCRQVPEQPTTVNALGSALGAFASVGLPVIPSPI